MILTGRQIREGRLLTDMTQEDVARAAGINPAVVVRTEAAEGLPMITKRDAVAIQRALEAAGVEFDRDAGGPSVLLRKVGPGV